MDTGPVGNYGTLRFVKKNGTVLASYPIDDEELTIGRGSRCLIRLYFTWVDHLHCKLVFEDRKAMLVVYGATGVVIDDCHVLPTDSGAPATVPLSNGSRIVMNNKHFVFEYPPKEMRAALISTPRPSPKKTRRSLRFSMIQSSHVFSPLKNVYTATPEMQATALRSPVKPFARDLRDEEEVVLVDGDIEDAVVIEEGQDLIVLEEVDTPPEPVQEFPTSPTPAGRRGSTALDNLRTPQPSARRRSNFNLHKAVLMRSAQRVLEHNDEHEEKEVELAVSPEREMGPSSDSDEEDDSGPTTSAPPRSPFRAFDLIKSVFGGKSSENIAQSANQEQQPDANENSEEDDAMDEDIDVVKREDDIVLDYGPPEGGANEHVEEGRQFPPVLTGRENPFLTPQPRSRRSHIGTGMLTGPRRVPVEPTMDIDAAPRQQSFSVGGAQRVRVIEPWKLNQMSEANAQSLTPRPSQVGVDDGEDAQTVVDRMKGKVEEMRRKSLARRERNSMGGRGLFDLAPSSSAGSLSQYTASTSRERLVEDVVMQHADKVEQSLDKTHAQTKSLYPSLPTIDFSARSRSPKKSMPATPKFTGMREMFATTSAPAPTPVLSGVKDLFKLPEIRHVPATPALEAARTMFESLDVPMDTIDEDSSGRASPATTDSMSASDESIVSRTRLPSRPASRLARLAAPDSSASSVGAGRVKRATQDAKDSSSSAPRKVPQTRRKTPEPSSSAADKPPVKARTTTRTKGSKAQVDVSDNDEDELLLESVPKPTRAVRSRTPAGDSSDARAPEPKAKARATRTAVKGTLAPPVPSRRATPVSDTEESDVPKKAAKTATARKVSTQVSDKENDESVEHETKPKRRTAVKSSSSDIPQPTTAATAARVTRSRARK
ncbi:hypothetical protein EXIGLDRAFT_643682 [Exidia glandulosa HHB12029]|uniref:FHA domain-containing protein n=1 Tax=Exidia glandulosa HHB12029 TaxID=1314781 RepID=A0A166AXE1_EXIGL|nr:hypothetical protein EXIGLDRAFT_643682 [Exidia glandulosa HHB12029]